MYSRSFLAFFCCVIQLLYGFAQDTTPVTITSSAGIPAISCGPCYVVAGFTIYNQAPTEAATTQFSVGPSGLMTADATDNNTYFVFTGYSIVETVLTDGQCSTILDGPIALMSAFSVTVPSGMNVTAYAVTAESYFIDTVLGGNPTCAAIGVNSATSPFIPTSFSTTTKSLLTSTVALVGKPSNTSSLAISAASPTSAKTLTRTSFVTSPSTTSTAFAGLSIGSKVGIGVAVPLSLITFYFLGTLLWIRSRRQKRLVQERVTQAELGSEARAEVDGEDVRYEIQGDGGKHELLDQERSQEFTGAKAARELTGGEHSHELEAPT